MATDILHAKRWESAISSLSAALDSLYAAAPPDDHIAREIREEAAKVRDLLAWTREARATAENEARGVRHLAALDATDPASYRHLSLWEAVTAVDLRGGTVSLDRYATADGRLIEVVTGTGQRPGCFGFVTDGKTPATVIAAGPEDAVRVYLFPTESEGER